MAHIKTSVWHCDNCDRKCLSDTMPKEWFKIDVYSNQLSQVRTFHACDFCFPKWSIKACA